MALGQLGNLANGDGSALISQSEPAHCWQRLKRLDAHRLLCGDPAYTHRPRLDVLDLLRAGGVGSGREARCHSSAAAAAAAVEVSRVGHDGNPIMYKSFLVGYSLTQLVAAFSASSSLHSPKGV